MRTLPESGEGGGGNYSRGSAAIDEENFRGNSGCWLGRVSVAPAACGACDAIGSGATLIHLFETAGSLGIHIAVIAFTVARTGLVLDVGWRSSL